jgi:class 3 adenylate cyclase
MDDQAHTFLFADLVGFTALAELEGDDRALEVAVALQQRVRGLLGPHRAEHVKGTGDGMMLRCSDPQAAIRLGLRLVEELAEVEGFPAVRVGIHTGPALASEGDWFGRTVNVAARLCAVAPGGEVMVSDSTREAAGTMAGVDWGERELHWLRNVSEPVGTYLVAPVSERAAHEGDGAGGERRWRIPWVCDRGAASGLAGGGVPA